MPDDLHKALDEGRIARNEIAHTITMGFEYIIENDAGRKEIIDNLKLDIMGNKEFICRCDDMKKDKRICCYKHKKGGYFK